MKSKAIVVTMRDTSKMVFRTYPKAARYLGIPQSKYDAHRQQLYRNNSLEHKGVLIERVPYNRNK